MPSDRPLTLLACQLHIPTTATVAARDQHLLESAARVGRALSERAADLVVLPELSTIDYSRESFAALASLAEADDGPSYQQWSAVARQHNTTVLYGFPRRTAQGQYRISAAAVGPDGALIGRYDKLHLAQFGASMEQEYFSAGEELLLFDVAGFKVAPIICFDIRPPELCRQLVVQHQADIILHCGAYYRDPSFSSWHAFAQTRAVENQVYFLSLNRAGQHYGNSLFVPPWIDDNTQPTRFPAHAEALQYLECHRAKINSAREEYAFLAERLTSYDLPRAKVTQPD